MTFIRFNPPPPDARTNPEVAMQWIVNHVPCFEGGIPAEWSDAVFHEADRWDIQPSTLRAALRMARRRGYAFADHPRGPIRLPDLDRGPEITMASPNARARAIATAKALESQYRAASMADDIKEMERILRAYANLIENTDVPNREIQHGAPLLRRAHEQLYGAPRGGRGGPPSGGGPYRMPPRLPRR